MNVLLICEYFAPQNYIAAIRFTKVLKYLARTGRYRFWVIAKKDFKGARIDEFLQSDLKKMSEYVTLFEADVEKKLPGKVKKLIRMFWSKLKPNTEHNQNSAQKGANKDNAYFIIREMASDSTHGIAGLMRRLIGTAALFGNDVYELLGEYRFAHTGKKYLKKIPMNQIGYMISTYGGMGAHLLALQCKKGHSNLCWIADYRDPVRAQTKCMGAYLTRLAHKADKEATYITGVTPSCIGSGKYPEKFQVIYNGYDKEDTEYLKSNAYQKESRDSTSENENIAALTFAYTGSLYYKQRDMTQLFHILSDLADEQKINPGRVRIVYAGKQFFLLEQQAKKYSLQGLIDYKGVVSRRESLAIQLKADILCALTWNYENNDNILTGKFLEYMMTDKPVFAIVTGDKPDSLMREIIHSANMGYCLEEATLTADYGAAKEWILNKYNQFMTLGHVTNEADKEMLEKYSYPLLAGRFDKLMQAKE